ASVSTADASSLGAGAIEALRTRRATVLPRPRSASPGSATSRSRRSMSSRRTPGSTGRAEGGAVRAGAADAAYLTGTAAGGPDAHAVLAVRRTSARGLVVTRGATYDIRADARGVRTKRLPRARRPPARARRRDRLGAPDELRLRPGRDRRDHERDRRRRRDLRARPERASPARYLRVRTTPNDPWSADDKQGAPPRSSAGGRIRRTRWTPSCRLARHRAVPHREDGDHGRAGVPRLALQP